MSKPLIENALATACPGNGLPKVSPVADRPRQEDQQRDPRDRADEPGPRPAIQPGDPGRDDEPGQAEVDRLVAGQGGQADEDAETDDAQVEEAAAARLADDARHQQAGREGEDRERHRRVGQGGMEEQRQVDRAGQPGADRQHPGASRRQPAFHGDVRGQPPGEDRHDGPEHDRRPLSGGEGGAEEGHRDRRQQRRERQPHLEGGPRERERRGLVAPQRVRDEAAPLDQVARDAEVVGRVLGLREDDLGREQHPRHERDGEDPDHRGDRPRVASRRGLCGRCREHRVDRELGRRALAHDRRPEPVGERPAVEDRARPS